VAEIIPCLSTKTKIHPLVAKALLFAVEFAASSLGIKIESLDLAKVINSLPAEQQNRGVA
jgi:hypothetical protein